MEDEIEHSGMKICHANETNDGNNDAPELNFVVFLNATEKLIGDLAVENYDGTTSNCNKDAAEEPTETK